MERTPLLQFGERRESISFFVSKVRKREKIEENERYHRAKLKFFKKFLKTY